MRGVSGGRRALLAWAAGLLLLTLGAVPAAAQRLANDPRSVPPPPPATVTEAARAFAPGTVPVGAEIVLDVPDRGEAATVFGVVGGACYSAVAVGPAGVDLDAWIRRDGELVAQDVLFDEPAAARWCADRSGPVEVAISAFGEGGHATLGLFVDAATLEEVRGAGDELANRLETALGRVAPGWANARIVASWRFPAPGERVVAVDVAARECVAVLAVGDANVEDLDLRLETVAGELLARDQQLDARPAVLYCAEAPVALRVAARLARGAGRVAVAAVRSPF
jgi:hypothetical protein